MTEDGSSVSKSALCQARYQLEPSALRAVVSHSATLMAQHMPAPAWYGFRVLVLDSTVLRVPNVPECAEHFGGMLTGCGKFRPLARASALWDVARGCVVDATLGGFADHDRALAKHHIPTLTSRDLVVMDRGYPSREWFGELQDHGIPFCARMCSYRWRAVSEFARSNRDDAMVNLGTTTHPLHVRLIRIVLPK